MMQEQELRVLLYASEAYIAKTAQIIITLVPGMAYCPCSSEERVFAEVLTFHPPSYFELLRDISFDFVVVATDNMRDDIRMLKESLSIDTSVFLDLTGASEILCTFEGRVQYLVRHMQFGTPELPEDMKLPNPEASGDNPMHIVMSFNSRFLLPACETIYTLFLHNHNIVLHILYIDLTDEERTSVERYTTMEGTYEIEWHLIEDDMLDKIHFDPGRFSVYTLYRFYAYQILDETIERCLWLDADLMIRGDIRGLYDTPMGDQWYFTSALESDAYAKNNVGENYEYTNIGTIVMNLKKLRSDDMMNAFWEFLFSPDFDYPAFEQDALNIVFRRKIKFVEQGIWNSFPISEFNENVPLETIREYADKARIVHFLSAKKVWLDEYREYWEEAAREIPYTGIMYREYMQYLAESQEYLKED